MMKHRYTFKGKEIAKLFSNGFLYDPAGLPVNKVFDISLYKMFSQYKIFIRRDITSTVVTSITFEFESEEEEILFLMKCPYRYVWSGDL